MNKFAQLDAECLSSHLEGFLIPHWSISAISDFIRNEKAFEKKYIFCDYSKQDSLPSIIGSAYHKGLMAFFKKYKDGYKMTYAELTEAAFAELDRIGANRYRPQKGKTIADLQNTALKELNSLLLNFWSEFDSYEQEIGEIIAVEPKIVEFVCLNGVEVPLPLKVGTDLIFINKKGELCILDHKAKHTYTDEGEVTLKYGNQTIANTLAVNEWILKQEDVLAKYPKAKKGVVKFYYYENKISKNRDGSNQIRQIPIDIEQSRALYESLLFEGVFKLMEAVQNPDYIYTVNPHDFFEDSGEILDFWVKTHIEGLEGFPNLKPNQLRILKKKKELVRRASLASIPKNIIKQFQNPKNFTSVTYEDMQDKSNSERIEYRLRLMNYKAEVKHIVPGYSCDTYLLQVGAGLKINQIYGFRMDIANALGKADVRILNNLIKYKGDSYVAIEVNKEKEEKKPLHLTDSDLTSGFKFPIGKDNFGELISWDVGNPSTPHLMIAGASGSGKSVAIKTIISVALKKGIEVVILDPKYEFDEYTKSCEVYSELDDIETFMGVQVIEMDKIFKTKGARGNSDNKRLIIFDEAADCFARQTKIKGCPTLEQNTLILAQKARSAGIHLVLAAQRFSVKVLSGDAKANFSSRLCLTVSSAVDSKVMLDEAGAEKLSGQGDALYTSPEHGEPVRIQCFIS